MKIVSDRMLLKALSSSLAVALAAASPLEALAANYGKAETPGAGTVIAVPVIQTAVGIGIQSGPSIGTTGVDIRAAEGIGLDSKIPGASSKAEGASRAGGASLEAQGAGLKTQGAGVESRGGVGAKASKASAAESVGALSGSESIQIMTGEQGRTDLGQAQAASAKLFDAAKTRGGSDEGVTGRTGSGRGFLGRATRTKQALAAGAAAFIAPATALADNGASASSSDSAIGGVVIAGITLITAGIVGRTVARVEASLDKKPTAAQIEAYRDSSDIVSMYQASKRVFYGDRLPTPGVEEVMRKEIRKKAKTDDVEAAFLEASAAVSAFDKDFAAFNHPIIAKLVRFYKGGGPGDDKPVTAEAAQRYAALTKEENGIRRMEMIAGSKDMMGAKIETGSERLPKIDKEMRQLEAEFPALTKTGTVSRVVMAGLATAGVIFGISLISTTAAVILGIVAFVGVVVLANIAEMNSAKTPEERKAREDRIRAMIDRK